MQDLHGLRRIFCCGVRVCYTQLPDKGLSALFPAKRRNLVKTPSSLYITSVTHWLGTGVQLQRPTIPLDSFTRMFPIQWERHCHPLHSRKQSGNQFTRPDPLIQSFQFWDSIWNKRIQNVNEGTHCTMSHNRWEREAVWSSQHRDLLGTFIFFFTHSFIQKSIPGSGDMTAAKTNTTRAL